MWQLVVLTPQAERQEYMLEPGQIVIGRRDDCDVRIVDLSASRLHAEVEFDAMTNRVMIKDLGSNNGTYVNGNTISSKVMLNHEDNIRIGMHLITVFNLTNEQSQYISEKELERITKPKPQRAGASAPTRPVPQNLIESVENYGMLFDSLNKQMAKMTSMADVLYEATQFLIRMTDADGGKVVLQEDFDKLHKFGVPASLGARMINEQSVSLVTDIGNIEIEEEFQHYHSLLLVPVFNLSELIGFLFIYKTRKHVPPFARRDMQMAVAASHQVELAIQRASFKETLQHTATHDALTGLPNRVLLLERVQQLIDGGRGNEKLFALFFVDIDNFKIVNDSLGHSSGDQMLMKFGQRMQKQFPQANMIARYAGDEFAMLIGGFESEEAINRVARELVKSLQMPFEVHGQETFLSISVGVATSETWYEQANDMMRDADIAMYHAKETSQMDIKIFDKVLHNQLLEMMQIQNDLRSSEIEKEFELYYQPIMNLETQRLSGFEALIRWHSPTLGLVMPNDFMSTANTTGALNLIDLWALHAAASQMAAWIRAFPRHEDIYVSVNVSPKVLSSVDLVQEVKMVLSDSGLQPKNLRLEITERASVGNQPNIIAALKNLKTMGVHVGLDDFGTGYSSLSHLQRLPIGFLKIDRSFVMELEEAEENSKIVQMVLALANSLDLMVIAEGVENLNHLTYLRDAGCGYMQGFLLSKPVPADEIPAFLNKDVLM